MKKKIMIGTLSVMTIASPIIIVTACNKPLESIETSREERVQINSIKLLRNFLDDQDESVTLFGEITMTHNEVKDFFNKPENNPEHKNNENMKKWEESINHNIKEIRKTQAFIKVNGKEKTYPEAYKWIENLIYQHPIKYLEPVQDILLNWIRNFNAALDKDELKQPTKTTKIPESLSGSKLWHAASKEYKRFEERIISLDTLSFKDDSKKVKIFKETLINFYKNFYINAIFK